MSDIRNDVLDIIAAKGQVERDLLVPDAKLADLSIASLDVVEIVFALEERFDIEIPFNANDVRTEFTSVGDILTAVEAVVTTRKVA